MCLYPSLMLNRKYTKTKKNGGIIPPIEDPRTKYVPIGCQLCMECRKQKAREWQVRLHEHIKTNTNGKFITLTFSNESIKKLCDYEKTFTDPKTGEIYKAKLNTLKGYELDNEISTVAMRLFLERWRKKYKKSLTHWVVTELGHKGTENVHMHGIVFTDINIEDLRSIWGYGFVWAGYIKNGRLENYVNERTVNYIIKYISKVDILHKTYKSKVLTSPGIGRNYINTPNCKNNAYKGSGTDETYRTRQGYRLSLPIYYRNKIYSERERERLWIQKLDKQERWVCGERINIKYSDQQYYDALKWHRRRNIEMGYGSNEMWKRKHYEEQRRIIIINTRIHNAA